MRTADRTPPSAHTISRSATASPPSGDDARPIRRRTARADDTNELFAHGISPSATTHAPSADTSTTRDDAVTSSADRYAGAGDCSARSADHDARTDHISRSSPDDSNSFTKGAAATAHRTASDANNTIAFCSRSISIGHRDGHRTVAAIPHASPNAVPRNGDMSCDQVNAVQLLFAQRTDRVGDLARHLVRRLRGACERSASAAGPPAPKRLSDLCPVAPRHRAPPRGTRNAHPALTILPVCTELLSIGL